MKDEQKFTVFNFAVELKKTHKEIKDKPPSEVGYSLHYIPWILATTKDVYVRHHNHYDFNDLLSVAFQASLEAEKKFDPDKSKFTTYARYFIKGALDEYVANMTKSKLNLYKKVQRFCEEYHREHQKHPSEAIILKELNISEDVFRNLLNENDKIEYLDEEKHTSEDTISLDYQVYVNLIKDVDKDYCGILSLVLIEDLSFSIISKKLKKSKKEVQALYDSGLVKLKAVLAQNNITKDDIWT